MAANFVPCVFIHTICAIMFRPKKIQKDPEYSGDAEVEKSSPGAEKETPEVYAKFFPAFHQNSSIFRFGLPDKKAGKALLTKRFRTQQCVARGGFEKSSQLSNPVIIRDSTISFSKVTKNSTNRLKNSYSNTML